MRRTNFPVPPFLAITQRLAHCAMSLHKEKTKDSALWQFSLRHADWVNAKLQALLYDILPSTTAVFSYTIGSRKLLVNEQFFVGAQAAVSLLQTTQIISDVCFITDHIAYASSK